MNTKDVQRFINITEALAAAETREAEARERVQQLRAQYEAVVAEFPALAALFEQGAQA